MDYVRVLIGGEQVEPLATSGASILSSTTRADGFVIVARDSEGYAAGEEVQVFLYDEARTPTGERGRQPLDDVARSEG